MAVKEKLYNTELNHLLFIEESQMRHKSRVQWIRQGDAGTKFSSFILSYMKSRQSQNFIELADGSIAEDTSDIAKLAEDYYSNLYNQDANLKSFEHIDFKRILNPAAKY